MCTSPRFRFYTQFVYEKWVKKLLKKVQKVAIIKELFFEKKYIQTWSNWTQRSWGRSWGRWQWGHVLISIFVWPVSTGISGINWISVWTSFFILKKVHQDLKKYERFICSISRRTISKFCEGKKKNINGLKCFKMSTWIVIHELGL